MTDPKTRWDKIQAWFKNNPIGVIILLLLAIVGAIATGLESGSKILDKLRS
jgi:predicted negative regulator of RcsB-dependent stress response